MSDTNTEMGFVSGTDFFEDETFALGENTNNKNGKNNEEGKKYNFIRRKMSIDSLSEENVIDKRKFINEIENNNNNGVFTDEEYEKSFHKVFTEKEGNGDIDIEPGSRKQSIEDDFMFNVNL